MVPAAGPGSGPAWTASGWEDVMPRIVAGERLRIGDLQTSPVIEVSVLPA